MPWKAFLKKELTPYFMGRHNVGTLKNHVWKCIKTC